MRLPPISYNLRSLFVRRSSTLLTVFGIAATVAVLAGVLALQQGFARLYTDAGREDVVVFLRPGANAEGESIFTREQTEALTKGNADVIATDARGRPLAASELYLAVRRRKLDGGETNVPIRGVQDASFAIQGERLSLLEGERFRAGTDEVIVGSSLVGRIEDCKVGAVLRLNTTPFRVVGVFRCEGPFQSEVWGDIDRMRAALQRGDRSNRVVAQVLPGADIAGLKQRYEGDKVAPAKVLTEREYMSAQTKALSYTLYLLGAFLAVVMGTAAVLTGTNSMLAAIAARSHEIGILLAIGFRPFPVFLSFLVEALALGLLGGALGCLLVLPLHGVETGTTNFNTFTEVAFAFRVTPEVLLTAVTFALLLGLVGGLLPAFSAARKDPVEALRRR